MNIEMLFGGIWKAELALWLMKLHKSKCLNSCIIPPVPIVNHINLTILNRLKQVFNLKYLKAKF